MTWLIGSWTCGLVSTTGRTFLASIGGVGPPYEMVSGGSSRYAGPVASSSPYASVSGRNSVCEYDAFGSTNVVSYEKASTR